MREVLISLTKDEVRYLKVKLHPIRYMHYVDYNGTRVSEFYATEKQGTFEIQKIKSAFNKFSTWEVKTYE